MAAWGAVAGRCWEEDEEGAWFWPAVGGPPAGMGPSLFCWESGRRLLGQYSSRRYHFMLLPEPTYSQPSSDTVQEPLLPWSEGRLGMLLQLSVAMSYWYIVVPLLSPAA